MAATEALIRDIAQAAVSECNPEAVILLGSHATGTAGQDSDIDLLVTKAEPFKSGDDRRQEMVRLWRALSRFPVAKDILVHSRDEVERWRNSRNCIISIALREGKVLYGSI
jgi:predicted nucleotidyltransferase